jgi:hypothetical protein
MLTGGVAGIPHFWLNTSVDTWLLMVKLPLMVCFFPTDKAPATHIVEPLLIVNFPEMVAFPPTYTSDR